MIKKRLPKSLALVCIIAIAVCLLAGCGGKKASLEVIELDSGPISGSLENDVWTYLGIPYAAPPVGKLRWREPQPVKPWKDVRQCTQFGPACPQPRGPVKEGGIGDARASENCLYLNVWTPAKEPREKLPVMVWIHGGGFLRGAGSVDMYNGHNLAEEGVVVVTINYRLGALGFFALPLLSQESPRGVSGNYGLLDQIEALKWVKSNIVSFGGDKEKVTVFGESAGAASIYDLMVSPLSEGLFHRAIAESGPFLEQTMLFTPTRSMKQAEAIGEKYTTALGCAGEKDVLAAMRAKSPEELLEATTLEPGAFTGCLNVEFVPTIDGWLLPDDPGALFAGGKQHDVPIVVGSNADEGTLFVQDVDMSPEEYGQTVRRFYGNYGEDVLELFPAEEPEDVKPTLSRLTTTMGFLSEARFAAESMSGKRSNAYMYWFTRVPSAEAGKEFGAFHGAEIPYVFGNLDEKEGYEERDFELSQTIMDYWTGFAATGDPNGKGRPDWPVYESETDSCLELGDQVKKKSGLRKEACDLANKIRGYR